MPTIYEEASNGTLTAANLRSYLANNPTLIDREGGPKSITPLAAACAGGHLDVVKLLLNNKANPDAVSSYKRTPFFFVTTRTPKNRFAIAVALIAAHATLDLPCDADCNTPLMNAVSQIKDKDVIHLLVDNGASLTVSNNNGDTAQTLAKTTGMECHLRSKVERSTTRTQVVDMIVSLVLLVISYANTLTSNLVTGGMVKKLYNITGSRDPELQKEIPEPKTVEDFKKNLDLYIKDKTLEKFFARGDPFLQTLAEKASALTNDPSTDLGKPEHINRLLHLSFYQPVIYCDDSGSMQRENRYTNQKELVTRITRVATRLAPDDLQGVELHFINSPSSGAKPDYKSMDAAMDMVKPNGSTDIGTNLRLKILEPLIYNKLSAASPTDLIPLKRPLLVFTITDGMPEPESRDTLKKMILECKTKLVDAGYDPKAVVFCVSQIGSNSSAKGFLEELRGDSRLKKVLHVTTDQLDKDLDQLKQNERRLETWILHLLTKPFLQVDAEDN